MITTKYQNKPDKETPLKVCEADTLVESPAGIVHYISNSSKGTPYELVVKASRSANVTKVL